MSVPLPSMKAGIAVRTASLYWPVCVRGSRASWSPESGADIHTIRAIGLV